MWKNSITPTYCDEARKKFEGENVGKRKFVKIGHITPGFNDNMKIMKT